MTQSLELLLDAGSEAEVRKQWEDLGTPVVGGTAQSFADLIRVETDRLGKLVRDANVTLE